MNWTYLAVAALFLGAFLIGRAHRKSKPIVNADELSEGAMWGYFLMLVGGWGVMSQWANPSDLFFLIMMVAAVLAGVAKLLGYKSKDNTKPLPHWAAFGFTNALVLAAIGIGKTFIVEPMQIPSSSMRPGLIVGDFILISKFSYGVRLPFINEVVVPLGKPARGDVVVFRFPLDPKTNFIKRIVGLPGDKVEYRNKSLTVNGVKYASQPLGEYRYTDKPSPEIAAIRMQETLPDKHYETLNVAGAPTLNPFAVLDFPRRDGCQHDETGFVCTVPAGEYLTLGDNRDNSNDGRYWGFVPSQLLAGKAFLIWMNVSEPSRIGKSIE